MSPILGFLKRISPEQQPNLVIHYLDKFVKNHCLNNLSAAALSLTT